MTGATAGVSIGEVRRRERAILVACAATAGAVAWVLTIGHAMRSDAHQAGSTFASAAMLWQVMMVAMMTPVVLPWIAAFDRIARDDRALARSLGALNFAGGYFLAWLAYSLAAAAAQVYLLGSGLIDDALQAGGALGGIVLIVAGAFQLTGVKRRCLAHCRSPIARLLARWDNGPLSGVRLGIEHGLYCVACCWALMASAFTLGVMNLLWMAALTLIVCVEQLGPRGERIGAALGLVLIAWGGWWLV